MVNGCAMSETWFERQAQARRGLLCCFYPAGQFAGRPILETREPNTVAGYEIAAGRWTDGGSTPWLARLFAAPLGHLFFAYLLHDVSLFDGHGWRESNRRMREAMTAVGASRWEYVMVLGPVRLNGSWQHTKHWMGLPSRYVQ